MGSSRPLIGPEPVIGLSNSETRTFIKSWAQKAHQDRWDKVSGLRHSKLMMLGPNKDLTMNILSLNRKNIRLVTSLITGHCGLRKHLQTMGLYQGQVVCSQKTAKKWSKDAKKWSKYRQPQHLFYVNQFGTSDTHQTMFTILELHRFIQNYGAFPSGQEDYPNSKLPDPLGVAGLKWTVYPNATNLTSAGAAGMTVASATPMFLKLYEDGPLLGRPGVKGARTVPSCGPYLVAGAGGKKAPVCRVSIVRSAPPEYNKFE
ncbi:hypothetical protein M8J77_023937 [Diaphorina citri]|nr:hypothetical protein M8J77_023937 [Diaphorina citri]